jgi:hypothetical protein
MPASQPRGLTYLETENFFHILMNVGYLLYTKDYDLDGSSEAWLGCLDLAQRFEEAYGTTDWDAVPEGYWGFIDSWTHEELQKVSWLIPPTKEETQ